MSSGHVIEKNSHVSGVFQSEHSSPVPAPPITIHGSGPRPSPIELHYLAGWGLLKWDRVAEAVQRRTAFALLRRYTYTCDACVCYHNCQPHMLQCVALGLWAPGADVRSLGLDRPTIYTIQGCFNAWVFNECHLRVMRWTNVGQKNNTRST